MTVECFFDTSVLLYAYDLDSPAKREVALGLIEQGLLQPESYAVSVQILTEFFVNFVRAGHTPAEAARVAEDFTVWPVVDMSLPLFRAGLALRSRWNVSLWDAMVLAAAQSIGARELITEDLNHGQDYSGVVVRNPFL